MLQNEHLEIRFVGGLLRIKHKRSGVVFVDGGWREGAEYVGFEFRSREFLPPFRGMLKVDLLPRSGKVLFLRKLEGDRPRGVGVGGEDERAGVRAPALKNSARPL